MHYGFKFQNTGTQGNFRNKRGINGQGSFGSNGGLCHSCPPGSRRKDIKSRHPFGIQGIQQSYTQVIELIRQFYDIPRQFRITGKLGEDIFESYDNSGIKPRMINEMGINMGLDSPLFDIKISAQRKNAYSKVQQNELALELYQKRLFQSIPSRPGIASA